MGELLNEFSELLEIEITELSYEDESNKLIEDAKRFLHNSSLYPKCTYQGISVNNICKCIGLGKTDVVPWDHVAFTIDFEYIKDINNGRIEELSIPTFAEEIKGTGQKLAEQFGYNQNIRNGIKTLKIPFSTTVISPNAFAFYKKLEHIEFEENSKLMYLGDYTFAYCENLHTIDLRNCVNLDEIQENTFTNSGLMHLKISSNIKKIHPILNTNIQYVTVDEHKYKIDEFNSQLSDTGEVFWYTNEDSAYDF